MTIKKYLLLASVGLMAVACSDKKNMEPNPSGNGGDNVAFGVSLDDSPESRTIYGEKTSIGYAVHWVNGDKVYVASPKCVSPNDHATYLVTADTHSPEAGELSKTAEHGIIWGEEDAHFYSIYPQRDGDYQVTRVNGFSDTKPEFNINLPYFQTCLVGEVDGEIKMTTADMYACFMSAKAENVTKNTTVNLMYKPFSTAIRFTLRAPSNEDVLIQSIDLIAPTNRPISGKYTVNLNGETPYVKAVTTTNSNKVHVIARYDSEASLVIPKDKTIELNAFLMLDSDFKYTVDGSWSIVVTTANKTYTKYLGGGVNKTLVPGKIHYLGELPPVKDGEWLASNWMKNIPRNVYLSEISIPGSWSSLNTNYQNGIADIVQQYNLGCRAFHIDCRYKYGYYPSGVPFIAEGTPSYRDQDMLLGVANGSLAVTEDDGEVMKHERANLFSSYLTTITGKVQPNEYMVVLCTFALNSKQPQGNTWAHKDKWYNDVTAACASNTAVLDARSFTSTFYGGTTSLSEKTVVGDVLGKVIVICGVSEDDMSHLPTDSKCLFVKMPLNRDVSDFVFASTAAQKYTVSPTYYGNAATGTATGITLYNSIAQMTYNKTTGTGGVQKNLPGRGYNPTLNQRTEIGQNILDWKSKNYKVTSDYEHDAWILLGLGGYGADKLDVGTGYTPGDDDYNDITRYMNTWITGAISNMKAIPSTAEGSTDTPYYPLGIVFINRLGNDDCKSRTAVTEIWKLNNKFHKAFDADKVAF